MNNIRIYIDTPRWYARPKNTDWQYTLSLREMEKYAPIKVIYSRDIGLVIQENFEWVKRFLAQLFRLPAPKSKLYRLLRGKSYGKWSPNIVYSHGKLPIVHSASPIPVIWFHGVVDPEMRIAAGQTIEAIEREYRSMEACFEKANIVLFATQLMMQRHMAKFPHFQSKFSYAPFFLNHIHVISQSECEKKHVNDEVIKILFVGRDGKRKGLDIFLDALCLLPLPLQKRIEADIVTADAAFSRKYSHLTNVCWHSELPKATVQILMREAHAFVMPSRFESYGFVYIEAMAAGAVVLAPSWESQKELCSNGETGILTDGTVAAVASGLTMLTDRGVRMNLAQRARMKCDDEYSPVAVARAHHSVFMRALQVRA